MNDETTLRMLRTFLLRYIPDEVRHNHGFVLILFDSWLLDASSLEFVELGLASATLRVIVAHVILQLV